MSWTPAGRLIIFTAIFACMFALPLLGAADRITVSLDGDWQIEDSVSATEAPSTYGHRAPVPGLANLAVPPFPGVDLYASREFLADQVRFNYLPKSALTDKVGIPRQERNYFWYHRTFKAPAKKAVAILRVNKAQFGTAVWLNGKKVGEHSGCFDSGYFNLTSAMDWSGDNRLVIRIGAHPAVLPETVAVGTDQEKRRWTPGIYDSVSVLLSDNPVIENVQVAPRIHSSEIVVQTRIRNFGGARSFELAHRVTAWKGGAEAVRRVARKISLKAAEERVFTDVLRIPGARLWTPEEPFLYVLETATGGDSLSTRFGMREFRFDTATQRAYLNGKVYFLRGSNITLHRFFEDPNCGRLPWDEQWVRKLLIDIPKRMSWNSFRFCIGPVPDRWLDIADEAGLLIQNEFFIWKYHDNWDADDLIRQFKGWMADNWNHPSVAIWDTCNETTADVIGDKIIPAVRSLDLSGRPWENSYNLPAGPDDPVEIHPYLFAPFGGLNLQLTDLEQMNGFDRPKGAHTTAHARILNEYDWLWVNRDGSPTGLTRPYFDSSSTPCRRKLFIPGWLQF